jgi:hypothetical protein
VREDSNVQAKPLFDKAIFCSLCAKANDKANKFYAVASLSRASASGYPEICRTDLAGAPRGWLHGSPNDFAEVDARNSAHLCRAHFP